MLLEPGSLVAGKLRVERLLGQGGMGSVYVATHVGLDQQVAVKVLDPALAAQEEVRQRFVREARASAQLKSDHVCRVMDVGALEDGSPYIEMELLEGEDLGQLIARAPLDPATAADHVLQACVAIAEAHARGIIHRDLKPANLFVTRRLDGSALVKVLDFGIATAPSSAELRVTKTQAVMGSPGYMSPESLRSARDVDARSDIWALGCILYEAVSGTLPFVAQTITELAVKVVMDEPVPVQTPDHNYAAVTMRCLQKDPALRYQNIAELAADLAPIAANEGAQHSAFLVAKIAGPSSSMPAARPPTGQVPVTKAPTGPGAYAATAMGPGVGAAPTAATGSSASGSGATGSSSGAAFGGATGVGGVDSATAGAARAMNAGVGSTTLGGSAGASFANAPDAPKKKRGALIAAVVVVLGGGAAAAFALTRGDHEPKKQHHREDKPVAATPADAAVVATPTPDAAATPSVNEDDLLISLGEMKGDQNWKGIIRMANFQTTNDKIKNLVDEAKQNFAKEQTASLASYAKRHDCTSAKRVLEESEQVLPDQKDAFEKAATCTAAPAPTPTVDLAQQASQALAKGDYANALALADKALAKDPKNETALDVAARAVCSSGDNTPATKTKATSYLSKLSPAERTAAGKVCMEHGIKFDKPGAPPKAQPITSDSEVPAAEQSAKQFLRNGNFAAAEQRGLQLLDFNPNNQVGLRVTGIASCKLGHQANLDRVLNQLSRIRHSSLGQQIRDACGKNAGRAPNDYGTTDEDGPPMPPRRR
ncbi:MAG: serine/threonine-protein kinase [Kofleriaceae bacterium]